MVYVKRGNRAKGTETDGRGAVLAAAREAFARGGQVAVEVVPVCKAAGVTTGALYHHFGNRNGLLRAIVEAVAESVSTRAAEAMKASDDDWAQLLAGVHCVLDCCTEDEVRMTYNEAPSIVGLDEWRRIEESKTGVLLLATLTRLRDAGLLAPWSLELLAAMVKGAIVEGAMTITRSPNPKKTRLEAGKLLDALLDSVRRR